MSRRGGAGLWRVLEAGDSRLGLALGVLLIFALVLAAYHPILPGSFLMDDRRLIEGENPMVTGELGPASVWFQTDFALATFGFWAQWLAWGARPGWYHAVNMGLHALSAILLWRLLERLKAPGAWLAGAISAVTLFPALGFFDSQFLIRWQVSDHLQYLPLIAPVAAAAAVLATVLPARVFRGAAAVLILVLRVMSFQRAEAFGTPESLYRDTLAKNPAAWAARNDLGVILAVQEETAAGETGFADLNRRLLTLYRAGKPWHGENPP